MPLAVTSLGGILIGGQKVIRKDGSGVMVMVYRKVGKETENILKLQIHKEHHLTRNKMGKCKGCKYMDPPLEQR